MTRVFIIDRQPMFRWGVRSSLLQVTEDIEVSGEADVDEKVLLILEASSPNVVLLDIDLPSLSGLTLCHAIKERLPGVAVIILTPQPEDEHIFQAIKSQASAYLSKETDPHELARTIKRCAQGEHPISESLASRPKLAKQVLDQLYHLSWEAVNSMSPLTPVETEILNYMAQGYLNKQIADTRSVSEQTIKNQITSILRKLNANGRTHAVVIAIKKGLVSVTQEENKTVDLPLKQYSTAKPDRLLSHSIGKAYL